VQSGYLLLFGDRRGQRTQWAGVRDALVRSVPVIEVFELAQAVEQVALVPDQRPVQQFAAAGLHPVALDYWVTWSDLWLCGVVILADQARDDAFSVDAA
jgi:hypothetical protein